MNASILRRLNVASCWATARVSLLDGNEKYEDSYAITQEFREWIVCLGDFPDHLEKSVLLVPNFSSSGSLEEVTDVDEPLEI